MEKLFILKLLLSMLIFSSFQSVCAAEDLIKSSDKQTTEYWEGKVLTARFRAGMCFQPNGKAHGVLILTHRNGNEDVYHLYGTYRDSYFDLSHSSGHYFNGQRTGPDSMEGQVKLSNGMKMKLKGSRKQNVSLKAPDCAPLN